jgi:hypothetical protein
MTLNLTGTITAARNVICPAIEKIYIVKNATTGGYAVTFKAAGVGKTGVSIPNGSVVFLYVDGTDVRSVTGSIASQAASAVAITGGTINVGDAQSPRSDLQMTATTTPTAVVVGSISGTTLTVTSVASGTLAVGNRLTIAAAGLDYNTYITALGTGTGGTGTYTISQTATVGSTTINAYPSSYNTLTFYEKDTDVSANQPMGGIEWYGSDASTPGGGVKAYIAAVSESATPDSAMVFGTSDNSASTLAVERMRISSTGDVLITSNSLSVGNTDTTITRSAAGVIAVEGGIIPKENRANTFSANQIIEVTDNTNAALRVTQLGTGNALVVEDSTNPDSTPFVVNASGNVGIGIAPTDKLHVAGTIKSTGEDANVLATATTGSAALAAISNARYWRWITSNGDDAIRLNDETAGVERLRMDSNGVLMIGGTNPSINTGTGIKFKYNSGTSPWMSLVGSASTNSDTAYHVYSTGAGAYRFYVGYGGTIYATNTTIVSASDVRLKENIRDLDDGLEKINRLKPRKFDWKPGRGADTKDARGFVAQEFETVFPDLIDEWKDTPPEGEEPYKAVRADLIPVLVKAIQELSAKNNALEARIAALEAA